MEIIAHIIYWYIRNNYKSVFIFTCHIPFIDNEYCQFNVKIFHKKDENINEIFGEMNKMMNKLSTGFYNEIIDFQSGFNLIIKIERTFRKFFKG